MKCEYCDNPVPNGATRCPSCGAMAMGLQEQRDNAIEPRKTARRAHMMFCPCCGSEVSVNARQCPKCGECYDANVDAVRKDRFAYIILGLFLGFFGVHDFYAGYVGRGIAHLLLTTLLGWLIVPLVVDAFVILIEICLTRKDASGNDFA